MELESYFDFLAPNDIRIAGSRIGIESVLRSVRTPCGDCSPPKARTDPNRLPFRETSAPG